MKQPEDKKTGDSFEVQKRGRGRPRLPESLTPAERAKRYRDKKRLIADSVKPNRTNTANEAMPEHMKNDLGNLHFIVYQFITARQGGKRIASDVFRRIVDEYARIESRYDFL